VLHGSTSIRNAAYPRRNSGGAFEIGATKFGHPVVDFQALGRFASDLGSNRVGELAIAAMPLLSHCWLPKVIGNFAKDHSDVALSVPVRSTEWITRAVAAGKVDIGLGLSREASIGIVSDPLMNVPLVATFRQNHRVASGGRLNYLE